MVLRRGFKAHAARLALQVREELGATPLDPLDPYALAELYGIPVHSLADPHLPRAAVRHFTGPAADTFSGALIALGDVRVIVENHVHDHRRRRATIAHEMAHVLLEHELDLPASGAGMCGTAPTSTPATVSLPTRAAAEHEADELAGELLIPRDAARVAALRGWSDATAARRFVVSTAMARWRLNATGARTIAGRYRAKRPRPAATAA
ncbi:zinc peptidase [Saccharomonospora sp. CUA-673]|uniref:ImmA/IrrE family metallo-endopeptidase n=1 Tax=Saccharomonospora sp. CUA-673 TaxID=1904969 RepID=UPI00095903F0|nr:ImmA/IrrE family metallo-endopeptidase [Saccharomonospora sp. CUA-673]OLT39089.1 zinc peptidase [Saccharomonospora sp. CUA-673]